MMWPLFLFYYCLVANAFNPVVDLGYSKYRGTVQESGVAKWLGIRYAAPPVGNLRFAAPQDAKSTKGIQSADTHGKLCIPTGRHTITENESEDCLFLDVYAPARKNASLPVYVWIQGGGFNSLSEANYDATGLIKAGDMDMVVVTFNYRVGAYGFLAGEQIKKGGSPNNGLKDQLKVLEWVQKHISKFGGNPNHVVIGGASAGAGSVALLLSAPEEKTKGLFHGAAAESQSFPSMRNTSTSQSIYNNLVVRTGCASSSDTLACLRRLDVAKLQRENYNTPLPGAQKPALFIYGPTVDGDLVPDYTYERFHDGHFRHIPMIFGDTSNEGTIFVPKNTSSVGAADTFIQDEFPQITLDQLNRINDMYLEPSQTHHYPNSEPYWRPASNAYGEMRYVCPGIDLSNLTADAGVPTWNYHYAVHDKKWDEAGFGVKHVSETYAIWGPSYVHGGPDSLKSTNKAIVPVMQGYWTSFIRSLDPNKHRYKGSPEWKQWGDGQRLFIQTGKTKMESVPGDQQARCKYLSDIGVDLRQ